MLSPMVVQYVVGLCCAKANPEAVEVIVGDMVVDTAAEKSRDVDVSVTLKGTDGRVTAFKGFEVKKEKLALDVADVEQLCLKFKDMPAITHRGIVSASGFSQAAIKKAAAHNVDLYILNPWSQSMRERFRKRPEGGWDDIFFKRVVTFLVHWRDPYFHFTISDGPAHFQWKSSDGALSADGTPHATFKTLGEFADAVKARSIDRLIACHLPSGIGESIAFESLPEPPEFVTSPPVPNVHTLDVSRDKIYLSIETKITQISEVTISGELIVRHGRRSPEFKVLENQTTGEPFAGVAVWDWGDGDDRFTCFIISPESKLADIRTFRLSEAHKNAIRRLSIVPLRQ